MTTEGNPGTTARQDGGLLALAETYALDRAEIYQLKLLSERLFEKFRGELAAAGAETGGIAIKATELAVQLGNWSGLGATVPERGVGVSVESSPAAAVLGMSEELALALADAVFGARADEGDAEGKPARPLTPIERRVLGEVLGSCFSRAFSHGFSALLGYEARSGRSDELRSLVGAAAKEDGRIVVASLPLSISATEGQLLFVIPLSVLMPVRSRLTRTGPINDAGADGNAARPDRFDEVAIELAAVLGRFTMPLVTVRSLVVGAVMPLGRVGTCYPTVELRCGRLTLFRGTVVEDQGWYKFLISGSPAPVAFEREEGDGGD